MFEVAWKGNMKMKEDTKKLHEALTVIKEYCQNYYKEHESCSGCPLCVETYDCELIECSVEPRDWNLELKEKIELD